MAREQLNKKRPMGEINVVPYIDVMLVLLVIFMITAPLLKTGVDVELPKATSKPLDNDTQDDPLVLTVQKDGSFLIGDEPVLDDEELMLKVSAILRLAQSNGKQPTVLVAGDAGVNYGRVVKGMALLQAAGVPQVGLLTEPGQ
ncbi:MAG: protein TolR [Pseudomonadota bacterium]